MRDQWFATDGHEITVGRDLTAAGEVYLGLSGPQVPDGRQIAVLSHADRMRLARNLLRATLGEDDWAIIRAALGATRYQRDEDEFEQRDAMADAGMPEDRDPW